MRNVLITGGAGFIGSNFVRHLLRHRPEVYVVNLDALTYAGSLQNLLDLPSRDRYRFVHGDIGNQQLVERLLIDHNIDTIVNLAAESHVDRSIAAPAAFIQTNVVGTFHLLEAARCVWLRAGRRTDVRFHQVSTDEVYGSLADQDAPFSEETRYAPNSPYSAAKASADHLVRAYHHTYGLPASISCCSNNYGPHQFPEKLVPLALFNALRGLPIPLYGDGMQVRDWLHVEDHCAGLRRVIERGLPGQTYLLGGGNQMTNLELVTRICSLLDSRIPADSGSPYASLIKFVADRPGHDQRYAVDVTKAARELDWSPRRGLSSGLRDTVDWYLSHAQWLRSISHDGEFGDWIRQHYGAS